MHIEAEGLDPDVFLYHCDLSFETKVFHRTQSSSTGWTASLEDLPARGKDALDPLDFCVGAEDLNCATGTLSTEHLPRPWSTFNNTHWPLAFHVWELSISLAHSTVWGVDCISFHILGTNGLAEACAAKIPPFCSHLLTLLRASSAVRNVWVSCTPTS